MISPSEKLKNKVKKESLKFELDKIQFEHFSMEII